MESITQDTTSIKTSDGITLAGTEYRTQGNSRGQIVIASAMATPRSFYSELAVWLARQNYSVLTFDYRGTGDSIPENQQFSEIRLEDWAVRDIPAAVNFARENFSQGPLYIIAHSLSGQIIGLNGDRLDIDAVATFSAQSGYWKIQHPNQRYKLLISSYVIFPLLTSCFGYLPWSKLFGGEDVPPVLARQWYHSCRYPDYLPGNNMIEGRDNYENFSTPLLAYSFDDDEWGYSEAVDRMMDAYENAPVERIHLDPRETDFESIGHFGFFKSEKEPLWKDLLERLESLQY